MGWKVSCLYRLIRYVGALAHHKPQLVYKLNGLTASTFFELKDQRLYRIAPDRVV